MRKLIGSVLMAAVLMAGVSGCTVNPDSAKIIAQSTGMGAAVTWIAYDDPDATAKGLVKDTLSMVQTNLALVTEGKTYTEVIYPIVVEFTKGIDARYIPLVLTGSIAILNGIDILFATNPAWKTQTELAFDISNSFINGAKIGLSLGNNDPAILQAKEMSNKRSAIRKQYSVE